MLTRRTQFARMFSALLCAALSAAHVTAQKQAAATTNNALNQTPGGAQPNAQPSASALQRQMFEHGLKVTLSPANAFTVALDWTSLPGADTYRVLRYQSAGKTPALLSIPAGTHYLASVLPTYPFVFRVVAYAKAQALDTTAAVTLSPGNPTQVAQPGTGTTLPPLNVTCSRAAPNTVGISWQPILFATHYNVVVQLYQFGQVLGGPTASQTTNVTHVVQNGLTLDQHQINVTALYELQDYPAPGQTTSLTGSSYGGIIYNTASGIQCGPLPNFAGQRWVPGWGGQ